MIQLLPPKFTQNNTVMGLTPLLNELLKGDRSRLWSYLCNEQL